LTLVTRESVVDGRDHARDRSTGGGNWSGRSRAFLLPGGSRGAVMTLRDTDHVGRFAQVTFQQRDRMEASGVSVCGEPARSRRYARCEKRWHA
jgi:hypothetical protein